MKKLIFLFAISVFLSGCISNEVFHAGAPGQPFNEKKAIDPSVANVYFLRDKRFFRGGTYPYVRIKDIVPRALKNGGYFVVQLEPGAYDIYLEKGLYWDMGTAKVTIEVEAGREYFYTLIFNDTNLEVFTVGSFTSVTSSGKAVFSEITAEKANELLVKMRESY